MQTPQLHSTLLRPAESEKSGNCVIREECGGSGPSVDLCSVVCPTVARAVPLCPMVARAVPLCPTVACVVPLCPMVACVVPVSHGGPCSASVSRGGLLHGEQHGDGEWGEGPVGELSQSWGSGQDRQTHRGCMEATQHRVPWRGGREWLGSTERPPTPSQQNQVKCWAVWGNPLFWPQLTYL